MYGQLHIIIKHYFFLLKCIKYSSVTLNVINLKSNYYGRRKYFNLDPSQAVADGWPVSFTKEADLAWLAISSLVFLVPFGWLAWS